MKLNIIDVNSVLHAAMNETNQSKIEVRGCPLGGVRAVTRKISNLLRDGQSVICAFDSRTDRKMLMPSYKSHRVKNPKVILQHELLYKLLTDLGVTCLKQANYEADDLVASVVAKYRNEGYPILIHTGDADLACNIVNPNISIVPCSSQSYVINFDNLNGVLGSDKYPLPRNILSLRKVLFGDKSDNIPAFKSSTGVPHTEYYRKVLDTLKTFDMYDPYVNSTIEFAQLLLENDILPVADRQEIENRFKIFFPRLTEVTQEPTDKSTINLEYYVSALKALKDYESLRNWSRDYTNAIPSDTNVEDLLFKYANSLRSGEFHVDRNLAVNGDAPDLLKSSSVFIREL